MSILCAEVICAQEGAQLYTHFLFSLVVNNVLMAMLRLLTHSQLINQTIQLAYDCNKYALDECMAVRGIDLKDPRI